MRRRRVAVLLAMGAISCVLHGNTAAQPDSIPAAPLDSIPAPGGPLITIQLEKGLEVRAIRVEPASQDNILVTLPSGAEEYIPVHKVRHIVGPDGRDRTNDVLRRRQSINTTTAPDSAKPRTFLLRGRPLPERNAFPLLEVGYLKPLSQDKAGSPLKGFGVGQVAYLRNLSPRLALGPAVQLEVGDDEARLAFFVRSRWWLGRDRSVELAVGPGTRTSDTAEQSVRSTSPAFIVQGSGNFNDLVLLTVQAETYSRDRPISPYDPDGDNRESGVLVSLGLRAGGEVGAAGWFAAAVLTAAVIISLSGGGGFY